MKISFIIPTINQTNLLYDCVLSLQKYHSKHDYEIIIIDDGSDSNTQKEIIEYFLPSKKFIRVFIKEKNEGFATTVNVGIKYAKNDIFVLVNNDVVFSCDIITPILNAYGKNEKIGVVGGLLLYPDKKIQHGGMISPSPGVFQHVGRGQTIDECLEATVSRYCIAVTGAIFSISRSLLNAIGDLNEDYFVSCEDTEYCLRTWKNGWRVYYEPEIKAVHLEGKTRGSSEEEKQVRYQKWYIKERESAVLFAQDVKNKYLSVYPKIKKEIILLNNLVTEKLVQTAYGTPELYTVPLNPLSPRATQKIVVIQRKGALGDVLLTTGFLKEFKENNYDVHFITHVPEVFKNNPFVDGISAEGLTFHDNRFFNLDNVYEKYPYQSILTSYREHFGLITHRPPELYSRDEDFHSMLMKMGAIKIGGVKKIAVLHPSVGWPSRTLSKSFWNKLTYDLTLKGYSCVSIGKGNDYILDNAHNVRINIHEARELMKHSQVFIGMDSGMMHVAFTTNIPVIGIFTIANPEYRVVPRIATTIAFAPKRECRFCLHRQSPPVNFVACEFGTNACTQDFNPKEIIDAVINVATF